MARVALAIVLGSALSSGCGELRGRHKIRQGNQLYREGRFAEALARFQAAEPLISGFWVLWLNEGLTCRQMMVPGAHSVENQRAVACALRAFDNFKRVRPTDPRGEQLRVQTLFDADQFESLAAMYHERLRGNPADRAAINGLIQTFTRWNRPEDALRWHQRRAALDPHDAEAQYTVGVFIWNQLFQRGGGAEMAAFDPRPDPSVADPKAGRRRGSRPPAPVRIPPPPGLGDIVGTARVRLADEGIAALQEALVLRPHYREAMVYLNLLYRQRSFAFFNDPVAWQGSIDSADRWRRDAEAEAESAKEGAARSP